VKTLISNTTFNKNWMEEALDQARIAFNSSEIPVGAVIIDNQNHQIIARGYNLVEQMNNPTLHAEIVVINKACQILSSKNLSNCDIYVTLEPCAMCAAAISFARIKRLFYAADDVKQGSVENGGRFFSSKCCFHRPEVYSGFSADSSSNLMRSFFDRIR
jgi:cytosine deaminase